jgi:hypothetical protein
MQPEQTTSAAAADLHATSIEQRKAEQDFHTAVLAAEQRITEQFLAANAALLAHALDYLHRPFPPTLATTPSNGRTSKRFLRNARWRSVRLLPYMDDFLFLVDSYNVALLLRLSDSASMPYSSS